MVAIGEIGLDYHYEGYDRERQTALFRAQCELAKELDLPREEIVFAMDAVVDPVSLFDPIYSDGSDTVCVMDQVKDIKNTDESWLERIALKDAVDKLPEREKRILALRFFQGKTQMEVSSEVGISQAQVSRLEKSALEQIRKGL